MLFSALNLIAPILKALETEGYTQPTPIQEQAIPSILQKRDLLGCAQTGTGKTAAFAIPMLQLLNQPHANSKGPKPIKALVLTPTRELAIQIEESFKAYGRHIPLRHLVIFGGVGQKAQTDALQRGVDILVATPGRLLDLMNQGFITLRDIEIFVLDEADRMLDMGFIHDVKKIIAKLPAKRQTLFFSATMPNEIKKLADTILTNPVSVEVTPVSSTAEKIQQEVYFVEKQDKKSLLAHLLQDKTIETVLVFTRTKHGADKVVKDLTKLHIKAEAIHGNKSQNARQRALTNFKARTTRVLVATDIAARGIDVDELAHVINYELPNIPETYVHRIGRTGRAGLSGIAYSFCDGEEKEFLDDIEKLIGLKIPVNENHPFAMSWQNLMVAAADKKTKGKKKPNQREPREREPNLSGKKKSPHGGGKPNQTCSTANAHQQGGKRRFNRSKKRD
ncbi:MAG: DEAD/DEAH box helicase [Pedobacter sp.]|nr:DEAD/DEAH box helicase [Pedobacter sp.]